MPLAAVILIASTFLLSSEANAAREISGGWNQECVSRSITCGESGRKIGCRADLDKPGEVRSSCTSIWGKYGSVECNTYDQNNNLMTSYFDNCP